MPVPGVSLCQMTHLGRKTTGSTYTSRKGCAGFTGAILSEYKSGTRAVALEGVNDD